MTPTPHATDQRVNAAVRKTAETIFEEGCCLLIRACDLAEDNSLCVWELDGDVKAQAQELLQELTVLFHRSAIRPKRRYVQDLRALAAEGDQDFQGFMRAALSTRKRRVE